MATQRIDKLVHSVGVQVAAFREGPAAVLADD
jgi:hypothetical protein